MKAQIYKNISKDVFNILIHCERGMVMEQHLFWYIVHINCYTGVCWYLQYCKQIMWTGKI